MEAMSAKLVCVHPNYGALMDTSGSITRMYQWDEDPNHHAGRFFNVLDRAIQDVKAGAHKAEVEYGKFYADNRYNWERRLNEWKAFLSMLKKMKETGEPFTRKDKEEFVYKV
jgi:hypothetical protein